MHKHRLPIFPLPVFLLPHGKMRLRIFEARYLRMIKTAASHGFVIKPLGIGVESHSLCWGSLVTIEDFNQGQDGVLEVDVYCQSLVEISNIHSEKDKLQIAETCKFSHWSQQASRSHSLSANPMSTPLSNNDKSASFAIELQQLINGNELLASLYPKRVITDAVLSNDAWVTARWLELLPLSLEAKNTFIKQQGFEQAKNMVVSIIEELPITYDATK